eukprot:m.95177 g.95177  ORF g.95177 m.95177 type:complete len:81 (-) comp15010_c0_seq22:1198-1440(-)
MALRCMKFDLARCPSALVIPPVIPSGTKLERSSEERPSCSLLVMVCFFNTVRWRLQASNQVDFASNSVNYTLSSDQIHAR